MDYAAIHGVPFEGPRENTPGEALKMRVKKLILCSSSLLGFAASPALAQTDPATAAPVAQTNPAQTSPETAAQSGDAVQDAGGGGGEDIVVTGLRQSLRSAQQLKRNSVQQIDAIVAEDIGKLPDVAVSDTAARIPGVMVERGGGEAGRVLIRGLPDVQTTYNGREIFTAETRRVELRDFPSGSIGAIEVFKTTTADLVEPGIAGLVNVRSHRPFDFKGLQIAGSIWGQHERQSGKEDPNGNLLISNRWDVGGGEVGALLGLSYTRLTYLDSTRSNTDFVAGGPNGGFYPDIMRITYGTAQRTRPSVNGALQWRPTPGLEFYAEGVWQGFRNKVSDREMTVPLWGGQQYNNIQFYPGTNLIQSGTVVNPFRPDGFQGGTFNKTNTYQGAIGGSYDAGALRITADLARTKSTFTGSTASVDYLLTSPQTVTFNNDVPGGEGGPEFSFANFDPANPANYNYRGFFEEAQVAEGDDWQGRVDLQYEMPGSFISRIEGGIRYVDRDTHREYGNHYFGGDAVINQHVPLSRVPLDYVLFRPGFRGSDIQSFRNWLAPTYGDIRSSLGDLRAFSRTLGDAANLGPPAPFPDQTYDANEKTYSAYGQLRYAFGSTVRVDGTVGVRAVKTELSIDGTALVGGVPTPVDLNRSYTDWLPNATARIMFTNAFQLRLAASKSRTRPRFDQYNPGGSVDAPPSCTQNTTNCIRNFNGGNPDLNTIKTTNYDASLEYYFSRNGFAAVGLFRRDLNGYLFTFSDFVQDPNFGLVRANRPENSGSGHIQGFEAQFSSFFDIASLPEWARGFGVQANATYLDTKINFPAQFGGGSARIPDASKWAYNLVGMYEHGGLSARLSYNYRSHWLSYFRGGYSEETKGVGRLDLSTSYTVVKNLTLFFDWVNMLHKPYRSTLTMQIPTGLASFPRAVRYEETVYSGGIRFRF
jgi:TonB-dependent receptor